MTATNPIWRPAAALGMQSTAMPARVDVAVIGAGIIGLTAMHHLVHAGADAALVEAGQPGSGASITGSGVVGWARTVAEPGDIDPRASGFPDLAGALAGAQSWFAAFMDDIGLQADLQIPGSVRVTGPRDPGSLGTVHPGLLVNALTAAILDSGGAVAVDEPLRSVSRHTGGYQLLTSRRKISATDVIIATGASPGPHPLSELQKRYRMYRGRCVVARTDQELLDQFIPAGRTTHIPSTEIVVARRAGNDSVLVWFPDLHKRLAALDPASLLAGTVPELHNAAVTHDWRDHYAATFDGLPRIGRINSMWYAGGAADPALGAMLGHHVASLTTGSIGSSPFAEIPHSYALTARLRARAQSTRRRSARTNLSG